jgi:hypothetical protein
MPRIFLSPFQKSNKFAANCPLLGSKHENACRKDPIMNATMVSPTDMDILRYAFSDDELEIAAEETALSYTYQTSAYNRCCQ